MVWFVFVFVFVKNYHMAALAFRDASMCDPENKEILQAYRWEEFVIIILQIIIIQLLASFAN